MREENITKNLEEISLEKIKELSFSQLTDTAELLRKRILEITSKNGGHLASNLGMVEASIVLHKIFNSPNDKIIFDVSHQCYAHKLLTGRWNDLESLRQYGGASGFTNRFESEHDLLNQGHSGAAVSAARISREPRP